MGRCWQWSFLIRMLTYVCCYACTLQKNKSLHMLHKNKTQFDLSSVVHSEYSHSEYDNYNNPKTITVMLM